MITNLSQQEYSGEELATLYSERGKAEVHQGEMKASSEFAFSSSSRKKSSYRGRPIEHEPCEEEIRPENGVRLQLYMLIYQLLHVGRCIMHGASESLCEASEPETESEASDRDVDAGQDADTTSPSELPVAEEKPHMHIRAFILQLLKVGATIASSGRYIKVRIAYTAVDAWKQFWDNFEKLKWKAVPCP